MTRILITGAGGFIGSFLVEKALDRGWETWAGIRSTTSKEFLQDSRIRFTDLPFHDKDKLTQAIADHVAEYGQWDYIIHNLGATKCLNVADFEKINYGFARNFIEALQSARAVPRKFILMSSLSAHVPDEDQTAYGRSKLHAEEFLAEQTDFPYIVFRPTGVYGPREKDYLLMLKTLLKGLDVAAGRQTQLLTFVYVKDLVDALFLALESPIVNRAYAISDGQVYTDQEYTRLAKELLGKRHVVRLRIPLPLVKMASAIAEDIAKLTRKTSTLNRDKYRIMKRRDWTCDTSPLQADLGFAPRYDLRRGLQESIDWYRLHHWL